MIVLRLERLPALRDHLSHHFFRGRLTIASCDGDYRDRKTVPIMGGEPLVGLQGIPYAEQDRRLRTFRGRREPIVFLHDDADGTLRKGLRHECMPVISI